MIILLTCIIILIIILFLVKPFSSKLRKQLHKPKIQTYIPCPITQISKPHVLCNKRTKSCGFPACSYACCSTNLLEMLEWVTNLLDNHKIKNWIACGTLLGWKRHKGFIPWDDDVDMFVTAGKKEIDDLRSYFQEKGYILRYSAGNTRDKFPAYAYFTVTYSKYNDLHLDIGLVTESIIDGKRYLFDGPVTKNIDVKEWKSWLSPREFVFPLKSSTIYGKKINIPFEPEKLLKFWYGDDCLKIAKIKKRQAAGTSSNLAEDKTITSFPPAALLKDKSEKQSPNEPLGIHKCFIINLDWQHDRLHHCIEQCDRFGLWTETINAIKGVDIVDDIKQLCATSEYKMKPNEVACYLSHMSAIQKIADMEDDCNCLILEDDITFRNNFSKVMTSIKNEIKNLEWDVILFGSSPYNVSQIRQVTPNLCESGLSTGTWAYMMNPKSARKIVKELLPITYPIDLVLTIPNNGFDTDKIYDKRFVGKLKKYTVYDGQIYDMSRLGIIDETSTVLKMSTSSYTVKF